VSSDETAALAPERSPVPGEALLQVRNVVVEFPAAGGRRVHAVSNVSFDVRKGETLGLVGESGCGKSSLSRAIVHAPPPTSGSVMFDGTVLETLSRSELREQRRRVQLIIQDPVASLNPRRKIEDIVAEPLDLWHEDDRASRRTRVAAVLDAVGIDLDSVAGRRPHEFSGGQCQRINIARALVLDPELLVCDEPVSALDVSVRAQIVNTLEELKVRYGLTMIFVGHDISLVKNISDRIAVMYLGKLVELGPADAVCDQPLHPYTQTLLDAVIEPGDVAEPPSALPGTSVDMPSPVDPPSGCRFRTRCPMATAICGDQEPVLRVLRPGHLTACHHVHLEPAST
jgi:peptide/nickel transport system ATP-binding protein